MLGSGQLLGESCCLPPARQPDRLEGYLLIAGLLRDDRFYSEEHLGEYAETLDYLNVSVCDAETDALRVQTTVTHEVANQLGQVSVDGVRDTQCSISAVVGPVKNRQRHTTGRPHEG